MTAVCRNCSSVKRKSTSSRYDVLDAEKRRRGSCEKCGVSFPLYMYEFDHRDPSRKRYTVSQMVNLKSGEFNRMIHNEMLKCDVVCRNCHHIRTHYNVV